MARITSIGMPKKRFVASAAEEREAAPAEQAQAPTEGSEAGPSKSKRKGWGRDPEIAKRARSTEQRSEDRRLKRVDQRQNQTTCFACRGVGHAARDCPNILLAASGQAGTAALLEADDMAKRQAELLAAEGEGAGADGGKAGGVKSGKRDKKAKGGDIVGGKCYRCNSDKHSLSRCPKPVNKADPTPFATCFVCLGTGHLSGACPQNPRGVYVNGGACKVCGSVKHRANDCPDDKRGPKFEPAPGAMRGNLAVGTGAHAGADEDDFMVERRVQHRELRRERAEKQRENPYARPKHEPAKNGMRGPAKMPGDEGAYAPAAPAAPAAAAPKKKAKVVSF